MGFAGCWCCVVVVVLLMAVDLGSEFCCLLIVCVSCSDFGEFSGCGLNLCNLVAFWVSCWILFGF